MAGRRALRGVARRQWRSQAWRQTKRLVVVAGSLAAAFFLYTEFKPVILDQWNFGAWKPKIVALAGKVESAARSELESLLEGPKPQMVVAAEVANIRTGPSTTTEVVARLQRDTIVTVLERRDDWSRIQFGSNPASEGWLHSSLLAVTVGR